LQDLTGPLVHIGYHKTGTNWLQNVFFRNSATGFRFLGEGTDHPARRLYLDPLLDFDAGAVRGGLERLMERARAMGLIPVVSLERLSGHPDSGGHDVKQIADRLREVLPEARILVVIREQRSMIVSMYKMHVKAGGLVPLRHYLEPATNRTARVPAFDLRYLEYHRLIDYYRSLFGETNVLVIPYEEFVQDPRAFVVRIGEFAGRRVSEDVLDRLAYDKRANRSASAPTTAVVRRLNRIRPRSELNPAPIVESTSAARLARWLDKADPLAESLPHPLVATSEERLRRTVADVVGDRYKASNRQIQQLLGTDLARFGWMV
jgi:sulfotransferase family protein